MEEAFPVSQSWFRFERRDQTGAIFVNLTVTSDMVGNEGLMLKLARVVM